MKIAVEKYFGDWYTEWEYGECFLYLIHLAQAMWKIYVSYCA